VRDGETPDSPEIGRYCGYAIPAPIQSSGSALWMKFRTDDSVRRQGFHVQYTTANTGGGGPIDGDSGTTTNGQYTYAVFQGIGKSRKKILESNQNHC